MQRVTRKTLGAGINLTCVTTPKFKRAVLRAMLVLPLGGEDAALRACLPQVLRRGTARLNDMQAFGTALDELYGARIEAAVRKEGENLCIGFLSDCIDEAYAPGADGLTAGVIGLLCDLLYNPYLQDGLFCAAYAEGERGNLIDRIAALKNDPRSWAPRRLNEIMCENEDYGKSALGTIEQAERITSETLYAAYRRALSEAQVELFYCGTMMPDEVEARFMATPLAQPREGTLYQPHTVVQARPVGDVREVVEDAEVTQGKLSLGFRTGGASLTGGEPAAYWVFQTIYGGSTSAKLFLNVREKKSLCYYASAQFVASKGLIIVGSGIENRISRSHAMKSCTSWICAARAKLRTQNSKAHAKRWSTAGAPCSTTRLHSSATGWDRRLQARSYRPRSASSRWPTSRASRSLPRHRAQRLTRYSL